MIHETACPSNSYDQRRLLSDPRLRISWRGRLPKGTDMASTFPVSALEIHQAGTSFYIARFSAKDAVRLVSFVQRGPAGQKRARSRVLADHVWSALQQVPFEE